MSISVLDSRIKTGVNLEVRDGKTYFEVVFYCSNSTDLSEVLPSQLYEDAWWAEPYYTDPNVTPKVIDYNITRVIPGADYPCLVTIKAVDKLSVRFPTISSGDNLSAIVRKKFTGIPFTFTPSMFGMRLATKGDVDYTTRPNKIDGSGYAEVGDLIYINYLTKNVPTGEPDLTNSKFKDSTFTTELAQKYVNKTVNCIYYTLTYYVRTRRIYRYASFTGINGHFPSKYKPGINDSDNSNYWKVMDNTVETYIDDKGYYWGKITRNFISTPNFIVQWKGEAWTWNS